MIRPAAFKDAPAIATIYNPYVLTTTITFEESPISESEMADLILEADQAGLPWLVAEQDSRVVGYAHASKWKGRCAYCFAVETSVYLDASFTGRGIGTELYTELFSLLKEKGLHTVIAGIALPNPGSIALHEKFGMRQVALFKEVGYKFGRWIDVGYWQGFL